ncbi:MAG: nucleoside hydrolase, partial [Candidatus Eisenbacteria bacterium]|nr:nucleoside hydrolase [Candidatus Eisenbacteria bacterium]
IDDAIAMALAAGSPEVELLAVTSVAGNAPVELCTRNCLLLNELLDADAVVAAGSARPLVKNLLTAQEVHGADGLGGRANSLPGPATSVVAEQASELLTRLPMEHPGEITLVATGPLTNIALALQANADAVASYARIIIMGGAFDVPGNTGTVAEFNIYVDPEAAALVLGSGLDVTLVPLDATTGAVLTRNALSAHERGRGLPADRPGRDVAAILHRALDHYMDFQFDESGLDGGYMHDPLAVAAALAPGILETRDMPVDVIASGPDRGRTVHGSVQAHAAAQGRGVHVAFGHDDGAFRRLLEERVLRPVFGARLPR